MISRTGHPSHTTSAMAEGSRQGLVTSILIQMGRGGLLATAMMRALSRPRDWWSPAMVEARRQLVSTLPIGILLCIVGGAVTSQQSGIQFENSLPVWVIGAVVAASIITELAPLLTGFAMIGTVGANTAAELAAMKVTEQVDALEVMGRDPVADLVLPRVIAGFITGPVVTAFGLFFGMMSAWLVALVTTPVTTPEFWFGVRYFSRDFPFFFALIKGFLFGGAIAFVACHAGLQARGGSVGVGRSTTAAVIAIVCAILLIDMMAAPLLKIVRI
jgi:phospholipid/cholesterol/gamma-HCH transport system permease protein